MREALERLLVGLIDADPCPALDDEGQPTYGPYSFCIMCAAEGDPDAPPLKHPHDPAKPCAKAARALAAGAGETAGAVGGSASGPECAPCRCGKMNVPNGTRGVMDFGSIVHRADVCVYVGNPAFDPSVETAARWRCTLCGKTGPKTLEAMNDHLLECEGRPRPGLVREASIGDAPSEYCNQEAHAWVSGWNAASAALAHPPADSAGAGETT